MIHPQKVLLGLPQTETDPDTTEMNIYIAKNRPTADIDSET